MEKVGNYLKEDLAKPGYKSKHESTKRSGWLEWRSHGLPTSEMKERKEDESTLTQFPTRFPNSLGNCDGE